MILTTWEFPGQEVVENKGLTNELIQISGESVIPLCMFGYNTRISARIFTYSLA